MEIVYRKDNQKLFDELLRKYIDGNLSSLRYTPLCLEYFRCFIENFCEDLSFILIQDKQPVALAFLPVEDVSGKRCISSRDGYIQAPLFINEKIEKKVFNQIDILAKEHKIIKIKFFLDPLVMEYQNKFNLLRKYHYLDITSSDCLLDLRLSKEDLWSHVRKGHKYDINRLLRNNEFEIIKMDYENPDIDLHNLYVHLHHKCSGKITRSSQTFDLQFKMLKNDEASLFGVKYKGKPVSFSYFSHFKKGAIYASAVDNPDFTGFPIYHAILWSAILYYKERECEFFEFSEPCGYGVQFDSYPDEKQLNISHFKRGFGGKMVPIFKGIKYFDKELFEKDVEIFKEKFLKVF